MILGLSAFMVCGMTPPPAEIEIAYLPVLADAQRRFAAGELLKIPPESSLRTMALNAAKNAKYATEPEKYKRLAYEHVLSLPLRPGALLATGGGFQGYWLLTDPYMIETPAQRSYATDAQRRLTVAMGGDQSVKDMRRALRAPGTLNVKTRYAPNYPLCDFVWCDLDLTNSIDQLMVVCAQPAQEQQQQQDDVVTVHPVHRQQRESAQAPEPDNMSRYALRVYYAYNDRHNHKDALLATGYTDQGDRMSRPGEPDSRGVIFDGAKNASFHFSGNDPLYSDHLRRPFDVTVMFDYNGDYEAAADAIGPALGLSRPTVENPEQVAAVIAHYRNLAEFGDWSQIIPPDRQGENGYLTGSTDRKLFLNLLDILSRAGRVEGVTVSYRELINRRNSDGVKVAIGSLTLGELPTPKGSGLPGLRSLQAHSYIPQRDFRALRP